MTDGRVALASISVLVSARRDSPWLPVNVEAYLGSDTTGTEMLVSLSPFEVANTERIPVWERAGVRFVGREHTFGRTGLHLNFNQLADEASGDWLLCLCDDIYITRPDWADALRADAAELDPSLPWNVAPHVTRSGPHAHLLSRGWLNRLGCVSEHWIVDCYVNTVSHQAGVFRVGHSVDVLTEETPAGSGLGLRDRFPYTNVDDERYDYPPVMPPLDDGTPDVGPWWDMVLRAKGKLQS